MPSFGGGGPIQPLDQPKPCEQNQQGTEQKHRSLQDSFNFGNLDEQ